MAEDAEVPDGEEDVEEKASKGKKEEELVPRMHCVCGTVLTFRQRLELFEAAKALEKKKKAEAKRAAKKAALEKPEVVGEAAAETEPKKKKGGNRRNEDPHAALCSLCRRKALNGKSVDIDEERLREMHDIYHPAQSKSLAQQRRQGRDR